MKYSIAYLVGHKNEKVNCVCRWLLLFFWDRSHLAVVAERKTVWFSITLSLEFSIPLTLARNKKSGSTSEEDGLFYPWHKRFP